MRVTLVTLGGRPLASLEDADASWTSRDFSAVVPELGSCLIRARMFCRGAELSGETTLAELVAPAAIASLELQVMLSRECLICVATERVSVYRLGEHTPCCVLGGHELLIYSVAFSPDGSKIVTATLDAAKVWSMPSGECMLTLEGHNRPVGSASFSPDGLMVLTSGWDNSAKLWSCESGECLRTLATQYFELSINFAAWSPEGTNIICAGDNVAKMCSTTGQWLQSFRGHELGVLSAAFSPDGQKMVTGSADNTAKLWNPESGERLHTLMGHKPGRRILGALFSPDGALVVTASGDATAKLWSVSSGECVRTLGGPSGHRWITTTARFSSDGTLVITASMDSTLKIWNAASGACLDTVEIDSAARNICLAVW